MSRYLTPLPGLLALAMDTAINQAIELDDKAADRLKPLNGKLIALSLDGLGIDLFFSGAEQRLSVSADHEGQPDTRISGSPTALLAMSQPQWRTESSGVRIEGDAGAAQALEKLFKHIDPDYEALIVRYLGPVLGHQVASFFRQTQAGGNRLMAQASQQLAHYLREESGLLVTPDEAAAFADQVDDLREAVDRLEARWRRRGPA